ncbi:uncharacterized protein HD556DRAFT_1229814, partial [Suillus plorans]
MDSDGKLSTHSQILDYQLRGEELEDVSILAFLINTYEERISAPKQQAISSTSELTLAAPRGRPRNPRSYYLSDHPKHSTHRRVTHCEGHNTLPNIVGAWFPRSDDEDIHEYYCASMLSLLKPWRQLAQLKNEQETWKEAFSAFITTSSVWERDVIAGAQYYYECKTAAERQS